MIKNIVGNVDFMESLRGKSATFMLALSNTATINIKGITQAGIPNLIHLTPTLDAEFVAVGEVRWLEEYWRETQRGFPTLGTPLTKGGSPFKNHSIPLSFLNLGLEVNPKVD